MRIKIPDLQEKIALYLKSVEIEINGTVGTATLRYPKASEMAIGIREILKQIAGEPVLRNEEMTFNGGEWVVILEE